MQAAAVNTDDIDVTRTVIALLSGGGGAVALWAGLRRLVRWAGAHGWEAGVWLARVDLDRLRAEARSGREAKARAEAVVREAEARVAKAEAVAAHACAQCAAITRERDELALRLAREDHP